MAISWVLCMYTYFPAAFFKSVSVATFMLMPLFYVAFYWLGQSVRIYWLKLFEKSASMRIASKLLKWFIPIASLLVITYVALGAFKILDLAINALPMPKVGAGVIVALPAILTATPILFLLSCLLYQKSHRMSQLNKHTNKAALNTDTDVETNGYRGSMLLVSGIFNSNHKEATALKNFISAWQSKVQEDDGITPDQFAHKFKYQSKEDPLTFPVALAKKHLGWKIEDICIQSSAKKVVLLLREIFGRRFRIFVELPNMINTKNPFIVEKTTKPPKHQKEIDEMKQSHLKKNNTLINDNKNLSTTPSTKEESGNVIEYTSNSREKSYDTCL